MSSHNLRRHYCIQTRWSFPGFFYGDASNLDDLVAYWNLRAADNSLQFIDRKNTARFDIIVPDFEKRTIERNAHLKERKRPIGVWARRDILEEAGNLLAGKSSILCGIDETLWNGLNIKAPMMVLGEGSALGVLSNTDGRSRLSFALNDKPFAGDNWFHSQHLVASISIIGAPSLTEHDTFLPPYVPELNEFLGRSMHFRRDVLRIEPERVGLVIDAADTDAFVNSVSSEELLVELCRKEGISAKPSGAGLLASQLIAQLGGVDGARVLKIPGVRQLIRERGPTDSFTRYVALKTIGEADPDRPNASFKDHEDLFIEQRHEEKLTPSMAFAYLVDKGLFRMGADLVCPTCSLKGWTPLDSLKTEIICEFCGAKFRTIRQLLDERMHYRRSGLLGRERNVQGAIPVILTLQQLYINLHPSHGRLLYLPSFEFEGHSETSFEKCEVDLMVMVQGREKVELIIGECKDKGHSIDKTDIENLRRVGNLFPESRFEIYYLLSKLTGFSSEEAASAEALNGKYSQRVIMLTPDELEPYYIFEHGYEDVVKNCHVGSAEGLANATARLYFEPSNSVRAS